MARPSHEVSARRETAVAARGARRPRLGTLAIALGLGGLLLVTLFGLRPGAAQPVPPASSAGTPETNRVAALRSPSAPASTPSSASPTTPTVPGATPEPTRSPRTGTENAPTPAPTPDPDAAPATAADFDVERQVIAMAFPLKEGHRYRYRDNFGDPREGHAEGYNHARVRRGDDLLRAHDGIDIYAATGTPVVAPFDGMVIDPATRWRPWIRERYGRTAAIVSSEPTSEGYAALLTHLEAVYVEPGQRVHRGEVIGTIGDSGNAEGGRPHLHFELRAPFHLTWEEVGEQRQIDAFNPYRSLRAADPKRSD